MEESRIAMDTESSMVPNSPGKPTMKQERLESPNAGIPIRQIKFPGRKGKGKENSKDDDVENGGTPIENGKQVNEIYNNDAVDETPSLSSENDKKQPKTTKRNSTKTAVNNKKGSRPRGRPKRIATADEDYISKRPKKEEITAQTIARRGRGRRASNVTRNLREPLQDEGGDGERERKKETEDNEEFENVNSSTSGSKAGRMIDSEGQLDSDAEKSDLADQIKNGVTGIPLCQGPPEKLKRDIKQKNCTTQNPSPSSSSGSSSSFMSTRESVRTAKESSSSFDTETSEFSQITIRPTNTGISDQLTMDSSVRDTLKNLPGDKSIKTEPAPWNTMEASTEASNGKHHHYRTKTNQLKDKKSNFFGTSAFATGDKPNTLAAQTKATKGTKYMARENDDFCSACMQSGSFLCCDTCPKSFHFLCLEIPVDPDNLPDGDWSCSECLFKQQYSTPGQIMKGERLYVNAMPKNKRLFGKLLFQLKSRNALQYSLPPNIKDTFRNVKSGPAGQYLDDREKELISERQLCNSAYGQSVTKLDSYNPEVHVDPETGEILTCYKCGTTRIGSWDMPENSRLMMRCDYCDTAWHLDCIPGIPRASLKILGTKWKCPLHISSEINHKTHELDHKQRRRLARNQKFIEPLQGSGFRNDGDIEVALDEVTAPVPNVPSNTVQNIGNLDPIPILTESAIKLDFFDKLYAARRAQINNGISEQLKVLSQITQSGSLRDMQDLSLLLHIQVEQMPDLKKLWDISELSQLAEKYLVEPEAIDDEDSEISQHELKQLRLLRKLIESKPMNKILDFLEQK